MADVTKNRRIAKHGKARHGKALHRKALHDKARHETVSQKREQGL